MKELLEAGVHFGHQTKRWNPKMKEYIFGQRNGIYIIDLQKTIRVFKHALGFLTEVAEEGKDVLMVGTKKQAQDIIKDYASQAETCYVNQRWLGGLLTNFDVIRGSVDRLIELEEMKEDGRWDLLTKKEQSKLEKVYRKLSKNLGGIKTMHDLPGALVVIDSTKEDIAISEAQKLGIPIVAVVDTNGDPENIDYPIPGNDDAVRAIELFTTKITEAIMEGKKNRMEKELLEQKAEEQTALEEAMTAGEPGHEMPEVPLETLAPPSAAIPVEPPVQEKPAEPEKTEAVATEEPPAEATPEEPPAEEKPAESEKAEPPVKEEPVAPAEPEVPQEPPAEEKPADSPSEEPKEGKKAKEEKPVKEEKKAEKEAKKVEKEG
jgi:small subunit ribosomal protein S2